MRSLAVMPPAGARRAGLAFHGVVRADARQHLAAAHAGDGGLELAAGAVNAAVEQA
jgi:hypothetical protein